MERFEFLTVADVMELHETQLRRFGGLPGLRDETLLQSAVAMPQCGVGDDYLHETVFDMAAAYLFHLVNNHPFADANKRVGLYAAYVFLRLNGFSLVMEQAAAYDLVIATAEGRASKAEIAQALRDNSATPDHSDEAAREKDIADALAVFQEIGRQLPPGYSLVAELRRLRDEAWRNRDIDPDDD